MSSSHEASSGRIVVSEVLLKLEQSTVLKLPLACKTCPAAVWQLTGNPKNLDSLTVRNYCTVMHTFTWDSRTQEEILDCDRLYEKEEEEEQDLDDPDDVPPFLRAQSSQAEAEAPLEQQNGEFQDGELET